jgi:hypothetical protein
MSWIARGQADYALLSVARKSIAETSVYCLRELCCVCLLERSQPNASRAEPIGCCWQATYEKHEAWPGNQGGLQVLK